MGVETAARTLQGEKCLEQHARACQQHEGRGDLCDGENSQAPAGTPRNPHASARYIQSVRGVRRWQAWYKCQEHRGDDCEQCANPEHAGVNLKVECAHRKP